MQQRLKITGQSLRYIWLTTITLVVIGSTTTAFLIATHHTTESTIREQEKKATLNRLYSVLPANCFNNDLINDFISIQEEELGHSDVKKLYRARLDNQPTAVIIPAIARDGYNGDIELLVGVFIDGTIAGVKVIKHKETPGLGDAIEIRKSNWIAGFNNKSLTNTTTTEWRVKKDGGVFDQLTGATITPRAVVKTVRQALIYYELNKAILFNDAENEHF